MVRFGVEIEEDEDNVAMKDFADTAEINGSRDEAFDDTFAYKKGTRIPGGYDESLSFLTDKTNSSGVGSESDQAESQHMASNGHTVPSTARASSVLSRERASTLESNPDELDETLRKSQDKHGELINTQWAEQDLTTVTDWPTQISNSSARFRILGTKQQLPVYRGRQAKMPANNQYSALDLDADLFGMQRRDDPIQSKHPGASRVTSNRPFIFRWTSTGLLIPTTDSRTRAVTFQGLNIHTSGSITATLAKYLGQAKIEKKDMVPFASAMKTLTASSISNNDMVQNERSIWHLVGALFDPVDTEDSGHLSVAAKQAVVEHVRKTRFEAWLSTAVARAVRDNDGRATSASQRIFANLTGNRLQEACSVAMAAGDFRLATLISLSSGDTTIRNDLQNQLRSWRDQNCLPYVELAYRLSLELLSGNVLKSEGSISNTGVSVPDCEDYYISSELDWKRAFGLHLWYASRPHSTLREVSASYDNALSSNARVPAPYVTSEKAEHKVLDGHYLIIQLYISSQRHYKDLFDARTFDCDIRDLHIPWLLLQYFRANELQTTMSQGLETLADSMIAEDNLSKEFASQLETTEHWTWSILVLLHMHNPLSRQTLIKSCLARNSTSLTDEIESFLTAELKLPQLWIVEAKALNARYMRQHDVEARSLMSAGLYSEAHRTVINHIAPQAIISGQLSHLTTLLHGLEGKNIDGWSFAGQIYLDAITLLRSTTPPRDTSTKRAADDIQSILKRLVPSLPHMERIEFTQRIAYSEISAVVMRAILQVQSRPTPTTQNGLCYRNRAIQAMSTTHLQDYVRST